MRTAIVVGIILSFFGTTFGQLTAPDSISLRQWFHQDPAVSGYPGISTEKAYSLLKGKQAIKVIVGVIDSGVDIEHEDLKGRIWVNTAEIPGNGLDDDNNGYIDDINGWNFIGGDSANIKEDSHEMTREYVRLKSKYGSLSKNDVPKSQRTEYDYWIKIKEGFEREITKAEEQYSLYQGLYEEAIKSDSLMKARFNLRTMDRESLELLPDDDPDVQIAKGLFNYMMMVTENRYSFYEVLKSLKAGADHFRNVILYVYNENFDPRPIVGDDPDNIWERNYGNRDVKGPASEHGTAVAGVIAANRDNKIGIDGVSSNAIIMPIRAVPMGDERDKDVANAIRYAVDNGARIINMSFGKGYSPGKVAVDSAVRYAISKGVLLIHAAGNENKDRDKVPRFPVPEFLNGEKASNWIEVGALEPALGNSMVASYSNYGRTTINLFAPGSRIFSLEPGNKYSFNDGTSLAAPIVAGIAALVWGYYPTLTVTELTFILNNAVESYDGLVTVPGSEDKKLKFEELSISGGYISAEKALKLAEKIAKEKRTAPDR